MCPPLLKTCSWGPFHFISTPRLWKRSIKIYPLRNERSKVPTHAPPQKLPKFSFPLRKKPFFPNPLGNIQKIKGADAATPSEMMIKGPSENLFHRRGVDIKWNGPGWLRNLIACDVRGSPQSRFLAFWLKMPTVDCETSEEYFYDSQQSLASRASED